MAIWGTAGHDVDGATACAELNCCRERLLYESTSEEFETSQRLKVSTRLNFDVVFESALPSLGTWEQHLYFELRLLPIRILQLHDIHYLALPILLWLWS